MTHTSRLRQRIATTRRSSVSHLLRTRRPYLGTLGVALAIQATLLTGLLWLVPALAFLAWSWNRGDLEAVFVAVGLGLIGTAWTTVGVSLMPLSPGSFLLPGAVWIALALLMATASAAARRRGSKGL
jgi:hypothetical protein